MSQPAGRPAAALLTPARIRELAAQLGVRPSKRLGQNFVIEPGTVRQIARLAGLRTQGREPENVLEVGPGLGSLTLAILEAGASGVVAVEIDPVLAGQLPATLAEQAPDLAARVRVLRADALTVPVAELTVPAARPGQQSGPGGAAPGVMIANLPYNVAVPVLLRLLADLPALCRGLVMVQAEVADRLCAPPGSRTYGAPSAKLAWYADARLAGPVPRSVFWPVPNVDSKLVAFTRRDPPAAVTRASVFTVIDAAFGQRRKTLRAALAGWAGSAAEAERRLRAAGIDPSARGESLPVPGFAALAATIDQS